MNRQKTISKDVVNALKTVMVSQSSDVSPLKRDDSMSFDFSEDDFERALAEADDYEIDWDAH